MEKTITFLRQKAKVKCDENCNKAWGRNSRPKKYLSKDEDDWCYLSDKELGDAPKNPQTYEDDYGKPIGKGNIPNKWCVRECERCVMSKPNEWNKFLALRDFTKRFYNIKFSELNPYNRRLK